MAVGVWRGVNNVARKVKQQHRGVNNVARKIRYEWKGVNNVARLIFKSRFSTYIDTQSWLESIAQFDSYSVTNPSPGTVNISLAGKGLDGTSEVRCIIYQIIGDVAGKSISFTATSTRSGNIGCGYQDINAQNNSWTILHDTSLSSANELTVSRTIDSNADRVCFAIWITGYSGSVSATLKLTNLTIGGELFEG